MSIYLRVFRGSNNENLEDLMRKKTDPSLHPSPLDYITYLGKVAKLFEEEADIYYYAPSVIKVQKHKGKPRLVVFSEEKSDEPDRNRLEKLLEIKLTMIDIYKGEE